MTQKFIYITFSNGKRFRLDAGVVAASRTNYYVSKGEFQKPQEYNQEIEDLLADNEEILDWLKNNMNWVDIKDKCEEINQPVEYNYFSEFDNAKVVIKIK